jgi:2-polyprenyl-6-methoxyphenol hydroxylase-like FAD-dependent oxidoreductase
MQALGGIVGQSLALALARLGLRVALRSEPRPAYVRMMCGLRAEPSVALLRSLKVWEALPTHAATAVYDMQVQGDAAGAGIEFSAWEQRVGALAWITDAALLERELAAAVRFAPHITRTDAEVAASLTALCEGARRPDARRGLGSIRHGTDSVRSPFEDGANRMAASPASGFVRPVYWRCCHSTRRQLGHPMRWSGRSTAIARRVAGARRSCLDESLAQATGRAAGELKLVARRAAAPAPVVPSWCGPGWVLLGDAAHVVHPLAG